MKRDITQRLASKAAPLRTPIEQSGLKNLNPESPHIIADYGSDDECECENLDSECPTCEADE